MLTLFISKWLDLFEVVSISVKSGPDWTVWAFVQRGALC